MSYKVDLEVYSGPFDLLLYLIKQEEVDVYDIPISRILERYLEHLESGIHIDINNAAEFLVTASTLMEIKSRMLLPVEERPAEEEDEEDPRANLVRQLLAFRAFKEASGRLDEMRVARQRRFTRARPIVLPGDEKPVEPEPPKDVTLFDLSDGYARLMKQTMGSGPRTIIYDEISLEERMKAIMGALALRPEFALHALFGFRGKESPAMHVAGTFFALLELVHRRAVRVFQGVDFGQILVRRRSEDESGDEGGVQGGETEPAGAYVEPTLPPPVERPDPTAAGEGADGKKFRARPRRHFAGVVRPRVAPGSAGSGTRCGEEAGPEAGERAGGETGAGTGGETGDETGSETDDEFIATDDGELRLSQQIDRILRYADEISERFEASGKGKARPSFAEASEGDEAGKGEGGEGDERLATEGTQRRRKDEG